MHNVETQEMWAIKRDCILQKILNRNTFISMHILDNLLETWLCDNFGQLQGISLQNFQDRNPFIFMHSIATIALLATVL